MVCSKKKNFILFLFFFPIHKKITLCQAFLSFILSFLHSFFLSFFLFIYYLYLHLLCCPWLVSNHMNKKKEIWRVLKLLNIFYLTPIRTIEMDLTFFFFFFFSSIFPPTVIVSWHWRSSKMLRNTEKRPSWKSTFWKSWQRRTLTTSSKYTHTHTHTHTVVVVAVYY